MTLKKNHYPDANERRGWRPELSAAGERRDNIRKEEGEGGRREEGGGRREEGGGRVRIPIKASPTCFISIISKMVST
jgi:hypothetical protein